MTEALAKSEEVSDEIEARKLSVEEIRQKYEISTIGWFPITDLEYDEWEFLKVYFLFWAGAIGFILGDWLNYGEHAFGEKYAQALDETERDYGTLRNYAFVCARIERGRRRGELSFSHHQEVAGLEPHVQDELLERAVVERWTTRDMRKAVSELRIGEGKKALPAACYDEFMEVWERHALPMPEVANDKCVVQVAKRLRELEEKVIPAGCVAVREDFARTMVEKCFTSDKVCEECMFREECKRIRGCDGEEDANKEE